MNLQPIIISLETGLIRTLATVACLFYVSPVHAASAGTNFPYTVQHWGSEQGLPVGPGSTVLQTREGHLWFGTEEGLGKFNGATCQVFDSFNTPEMKGNAARVLFEDREGNLWIGNGNKGLLRFRDGVFTHFGQESGLSNGSVSGIAQDSGGTLWVGTDGGGLFRFENEKCVAVAIPEADQSSFINSLACTPDGSVWVGNQAGLHRVKNTGSEWFNLKNIHALHVDERGQLWIGGNGILARVVDGQPVLEAWDDRWERIDGIATSPDGVLWLATPHGIFRRSDNETARYRTEDGLSGELFTNLMVDREGSVWICSNASGIDQLKPSRFRVIGTGQGLSHPTVTSILEAADGAMWIATENGLNRFLDGEMTVFGQDEGLSWNMIFTVAEEADGTIWAGAWKGLNRLQNGNITQYGVEDGLPGNTIWCSYRDPDGTVWFGTAKGVVARRNAAFTTLNHANSGLSHDDVRCLLRDRQGRFWVGTSYGLNLLQDGRFQNFFEAAKDQPFNIILTLHEDAGGGVWFGTQGNGLFVYRDGRFTRFTTAGGLFDNTVFKILEDDSNNLWLTSNRGLFQVSRKQLEAVARGEMGRVTGRIFGRQDGLPSSEFNGTIQPNSWKTRDGQLWFGSMAGAVIVDPGQMFTNLVPPKVSIESVTLDGQPGRVQSDTIVVPPGIERIRFDYSVLSYISPGALKSRYQLEGFDRTWVTNTANHEAQFTKLEPGNYRFHIAAANGDGIWNEEGVSVAMIVQPFFWQRSWFQFAAGLLAVTALVWVVRIWTAHSHRLALESLERKHTLERERTRISTDLHDDVGSNLGSISLLSRSVQRRAGDAFATDLGEISRLAQETSDAMRDIVWFINPNEDAVEKMSLRMKDTAAVLLGGGKFVFKTADLSATTRLSPQFKRQFFLIFKESLHNVSKHANATKVVIRLSVSSGQLILEVQDDGCGLREPENNRGNGLASMRRRAADQQWKFEIKSRSEGGTLVRLEARLEWTAEP